MRKRKLSVNEKLTGKLPKTTSNDVDKKLGESSIFNVNLLSVK